MTLLQPTQSHNASPIYTSGWRTSFNLTEQSRHVTFTMLFLIQGIGGGNCRLVAAILLFQSNGHLNQVKYPNLIVATLGELHPSRLLRLLLQLLTLGMDG